MRVLGIEGTAWAASAAVFETDHPGPDAEAEATVETGPGTGVFDPETDSIFVETDAYHPDSGGIHPREAAEHMGEAIPRVVEAALARAESLDVRESEDSRAEQDPSSTAEVADRSSAGRRAPPVDAVAFSRGPGLGPCLRVVGTAARALAGTLDVPLVGVNHMVAHLEIGRYFSGFESPVCLNASGANAHLLGFRDGRYRVLGETMDTGVGNAIDKFTRHVGWTHPGGPKVESAAEDGEYVDLPYVVKGMDFSFSGIMSAAKDRYDAGEPVENVCRGLQETIFAMLAEVSERALSLTGTDELVLGGGVGQNARLREMLAEMCAARDADFYAPEPRFLRDNAGMIAVLGARMYAAGDALPIAASSVDPNFRPDEVPVTWRSGESVARDVTDANETGDAETAPAAIEPIGDSTPAVRGAEATVDVGADRVVKRRLPKAYRHPDLDARLRRDRTVAEARLTSEARRHGVPTPLVCDADVSRGVLTLQRVGDADLARALSVDRARAVGEHLATLHRAGVVHGDPTTRNVRVVASSPRPSSSSDGRERVFLIDFGLGSHSGHVEDHAMDLHVFEQSIEGTAAAPAPLIEAFEDGYRASGDPAVLERLREIEGRGRYR